MLCTFRSRLHTGPAPVPVTRHTMPSPTIHTHTHTHHYTSVQNNIKMGEVVGNDSAKDFRR
jgi:hypothetical protein